MAVASTARRGLSPWPYLALAAFSLVATVVAFALLILLGVMLGVVGASIGAFARSEGMRFDGVRLFAAGVALLVGPVALMTAAVL